MKKRKVKAPTDRVETLAGILATGLTRAEVHEWTTLPEQDWKLSRSQCDRLVRKARHYLKRQLDMDGAYHLAVSLRRLDDLYALMTQGGNLNGALAVEKARIALLRVTLPRPVPARRIRPGQFGDEARKLLPEALDGLKATIAGANEAARIKAIDTVTKYAKVLDAPPAKTAPAVVSFDAGGLAAPAAPEPDEKSEPPA